VRLDESKAGSFSDRAPSIAGSISFARGERIAVAQVVQRRNPRPEGARTRRMLAQGIDSLDAIEECFVHKEIA
jgi:hypothetical protein